MKASSPAGMHTVDISC